MAEQKRRTEIRIETHEVTIIRFGTVKRIDPIEITTDAEVLSYEERPIPTAEVEDDQKEKRK